MIYVASSWRNPYSEDVVRRLRQEGFPVYDFRNPPHGGAGKRVIAYIPEMVEPELMYKLFDHVVDNLDSLVQCLKK